MFHLIKWPEIKCHTCFNPINTHTCTSISYNHVNTPWKRRGYSYVSGGLEGTAR